VRMIVVLTTSPPANAASSASRWNPSSRAASAM
jgi:hypothetical protein